MTHYVYLFLAKDSSIYSPVRVDCYWASNNIPFIFGKSELYPGHVKVFSTNNEDNNLSIATTKKKLDFSFELPKKEMDVGYLITNASGKITIRQVDPCKMLTEEKLVRKPACEMERVPLHKTEESPNEADETMSIPSGGGITAAIWILAFLYTAFIGID